MKFRLTFNYQDNLEQSNNIDDVFIKLVKHIGYICIEFDTTTKTSKVLPNG